jgi:hypothetical protein
MREVYQCPYLDREVGASDYYPEESRVQEVPEWIWDSLCSGGFITLSVSLSQFFSNLQPECTSAC